MVNVAEPKGRPTIADPVWERARPVLTASIGRGKRYAANKVAEALGLSSASISQWVSGKNRPEMRNLLRVWEFIGRDPAELYGDETDGLALSRKLDRIARELGITSDRMLTLWSVGAADKQGDQMRALPEYVRRAAMAVVHTEDCTVEEAFSAAWLAWQDLDDKPGEFPRGWTDHIIERLAKRKQSGTRRATVAK